MKRARWWLVPALFLTALAPAAAQPGSTPGSDGSFQFRVGGFFPAGDSAVWEDAEATFFQSADDFNGGIIGASYILPMSNLFEVGFNLDFYDASDRTSYREWTDAFGAPILHDATLRLAPATIDFRILPIGRFAQRGPDGRFLARRPVPYIGFGGGLAFWEYEEFGDFLDFSIDPDNPDLFYGEFSDSGVELEYHIVAGLEIPVAANWNLFFEGRRSWATVDDWEGLGELDLGGTSVAVGASLQF